MNIEKILEKENRRFLLQSIKLSRGIDAYKQTLGLDPKDVTTFKNEIELFLYIAEHYHSFTESFILYNIDNMRKRLADMVIHCTHSKNYSNRIGELLGIEPLRETSRVNFPEFGFLIGIQK